MSLIKCPDCGKMFSEYAECCPECGCPTEDAKVELVNTERQAPFANPSFPKKQEEINHAVSEDKAEPFIQDNCDRKLQQPENTIQDNSDFDIPENKRKLTEKLKISETSKGEKYFSIAVIVCVLMVGLIILGIIGRCSTERSEHKRDSVENVAKELETVETGKDAFTEQRTYSYNNVWEEEMDDGYGNPSTVEASESVTIKFTPQNSVRIEYEVQEFQEWEGTYIIDGQTVTMKVNVVHEPERKEVINAKLEGDKLILENNNVCGVVKLIRNDVSKQDIEVVKAHEWGDDMLHHHLVGTMSDETGKYPIELDFDYFNDGSGTIENAIYKNVEFGGKIKMDGEVSRGGMFIFKGKDGNKSFTIRIDSSTLEGDSFVGDKNLIVSLNFQCNHS